MLPAAASFHRHSPSEDAGLAVVMAAEGVEAAAVGVGGERREDHQDSDGAGEHLRIVLPARK